MGRTEGEAVDGVRGGRYYSGSLRYGDDGEDMREVTDGTAGA